MNQANPFTEQADPIRQQTDNSGAIKWLVAIGCLFVLGLAVCSGITWVAIERTAYSYAEVDGAVEPYNMDDYALVSESTRSRSIDPTAEDASDIEAVVQSILSAIETGDVSRHLDADGYIAQMNRSGRGYRADLFEILQIKADIESSMNVPDYYEHFFVHSMKSLSDDWVVVYLTLWDSDAWEYAVSHRWWMVRRDGRWKLADFEDLDVGTSEAAGYADMYRLWDDPHIDNYYDFYAELHEVYGAFDDDDIEQKLNKLGRIQVPAALRDELYYELARAYVFAEKTELAEQAFSRVQVPDRIPGTLIGLARCAEQRDDHQKVIEQTDRYLQRLGESATASLLRARAFQHLGDAERAVKEWKTVLSIQRDNTPAIWELARLLPEDRAAELGALIPSSVASEIREYVRYGPTRQDGRAMGVIAAALDHAGATSAANEMWGMHWNVLRNPPRAASHFLRALAESDEADRERIMPRYLQAMSASGEAVEGFRQAKAYQDPMPYLVEPPDSQRHEPDSDEILEICRLHEQDNPHDAALYYLRATAFLEQKDADGAAGCLEQALECGNASERLVEQIDQLMNTLAIVRQREMERYLDSDHEESVFRYLALHRLGTRKLETVRALLEAHPDEAATDSSRREIEALLAEQTGDVARARELLELGRNEDEEGQHSLLLARSMVATDDWEASLRQSGEAEELALLMAEHFAQTARWEDLEKLIRLGEDLGLPEPSIDWWRIRLGVHQGNDSMIAAAAERSGESLWDDYDYESLPWQIRSLVAMLKAERWEAARARSEQLEDQFYEPIAAVLYHLQKKEVEAAIEAIERLQAAELTQELDAWPEATAPFREDERYAAQLASLDPPTLPWSVTDEQMDLFFAPGQAPSESVVAQRLKERFGDDLTIVWSSLDSFDPAVVRYASRIEHLGIPIVLALCASDDRDSFRRGDTPLPELAGHSDCMSVAAINWAGRFQPQAERAVAEVAAVVAGSDARAAYCAWDQLFHSDPFRDLRDRLDGRPVGVFRTHGFPPQLDPPGWQHELKISQQLAEYEQTGEGPQRVAVAVDLGRARETLWLKVLDPPEKGSDDRLLCEVETESFLFDAAKPGQRLRVPFQRIVRWQEDPSAR